jgi:hypothetical protein
MDLILKSFNRSIDIAPAQKALPNAPNKWND